MRLVRAELLKIRRRQASWVLLIVTLVLMVAIFLLSAVRWQIAGIVEFPQVYGAIAEYAYGVGALMAVVFAAVFVGSDYGWGVMRNVVARGESRAGYLLAKAAALAIVFALALVLLYAVGIGMAYVAGMVVNVPVASPLRGRGLLDLVDSVVLGYPVLLERAAIGFAVAVMVRSQVAGAVVGIVLFIGESLLKITLMIASLPGAFGDAIGGNPLRLRGPEWYQLLPVSVGDYVLGGTPGGSGGLTSFLEEFFIRPVPFETALVTVFAYMAIALALAVVAFNRQEIA